MPRQSPLSISGEQTLNIAVSAHISSIANSSWSTAQLMYLASTLGSNIYSYAWLKILIHYSNLQMTPKNGRQYLLVNQDSLASKFSQGSHGRFFVSGHYLNRFFQFIVCFSSWYFTVKRSSICGTKFFGPVFSFSWKNIVDTKLNIFLVENIITTKLFNLTSTLSRLYVRIDSQNRLHQHVPSTEMHLKYKWKNAIVLKQFV